MSKMRFRIRYTWGQGEWSYSYFATVEEAMQSATAGMSKLAYTIFGRPYQKQAHRWAIQERSGSRWKTFNHFVL